MTTRRLDDGRSPASHATRMDGAGSPPPPALTSSWLSGSQYTASYMTNLLKPQKPQTARSISSAHDSTFSGTGTASSRKGKGHTADYNNASALSTTRTADRAEAGLTMSDYYGNTNTFSTMQSRSGRHGSASEQTFVHPLLVAARDAVASLEKGEFPSETTDGPILPPVFGTGLMSIPSDNHSPAAPAAPQRSVRSSAARSTHGKTKKRKPSVQRPQHSSSVASLLPDMEIFGLSYDASSSPLHTTTTTSASTRFNQTAPARIGPEPTEKKPTKKLSTTTTSSKSATTRSARTADIQLPPVRVEGAQSSEIAVTFLEPQSAGETIRSAAMMSIQAMDANIAAWDAEMYHLHEECHARRAERREDVYKFRSTYTSPVHSRNATADSVLHAYESELRREQYRETRRQHESPTKDEALDSETSVEEVTRSNSSKQKKTSRKKRLQRAQLEVSGTDSCSREQQQQFFRDYYNFARTMPKDIFPAFAPPLKRRVFLVEPYTGKNSQVRLYHTMLAEQQHTDASH